MLRILLISIILILINSPLLFSQCPLNLGETSSPPEDEMLLYFPFDGSAENYGDSLYSAEVNGAKYVDSGCGQGLEFDGEDDYVLVTPSLYLDEDYTVTAWINARNFDDAMGIFSIREQCDISYRGYSISQLNFGDYNVQTLNNQVNKHIDCIGFSNGDRYTNANINIPKNEDVFVGLTVENNSSEDRVVRLFVNCNEYKTEMVIDFPTGPCFDPLIDYLTTIGASSNVAGHESSFNGIVDEVRVYERVLSHSELLDVYRDCNPLEMEITRFTDCESDSAVVTLNNTQLGVDYQLYDLTNDTVIGSSMQGNCSTLLFFTDRVDTITRYEIIATDTLLGCSIRLDSVITIFPFDSLDASFDFPNFACLGDSAEVRYTGSPENSIQWQISTPTYTDSTFSGRDSFQLNFIDTGRYVVSLIVEGQNGCVDTLSQNLGIESPWVEARFSVVEGFCGDSISINIDEESISVDTVDYIREWSFFDPSDSLVSTERPFYITEPGEYTIVLKVTDSRGCMDSTKQTVSSPLIGLGCCPDLLLDSVEACDPDRVELCGQVNLDSCVVDYLYAEYSFFYDDSLENVERAPVDSNGRFCFIVDESYLEREACLKVWVDLFFVVDSAATDTIVFGSEFVNPDGDCINEKCCPEDTIRINIAKNLCLTGSNYEGAHFEVEGSILLNDLPGDLEYCGNRPRFENGVEIDYEYFTAFGGVVKFAGILYIPNPDELERDPETGKYLIRGSMVFCDENGVECVLDVYFRLSRSQLDMCVGMPGLMCMHFGVNTYQYRPPIPPQQFNGRVYLPLSVRVPFGTRYNEETECEVDRYDYEICGIPRQSNASQSCKPIVTGHIERNGNEMAGMFFEFLSIPVEEWNRYSGIQVRFWNNCGDTCDLEPITVVPLAGGRSVDIEAESEEQPFIYPVPFTDHFIIRYPASWESNPFIVYASNGKQVAAGNLTAGLNEVRVNTSTWSAGTYIFHAKGVADREAKIILIKH